MLIAIGENSYIRSDLIREIHLRPDPIKKSGYYIQYIYEGKIFNEYKNEEFESYENALDDLEITISLFGE